MAETNSQFLLLGLLLLLVKLLVTNLPLMVMSHVSSAGVATAAELKMTGSDGEVHIRTSNEQD